MHMSVGTRLVRVWNAVVGKADEGQYRPGPYHLPISGGWLSPEAGSFWNWWQLGYNVGPGPSHMAMVEACISAYAQTVAMCPGDHWRRLKNNGRERVVNSALTRILKQPNCYQSISDFMMNLTRSLYMDGNAYALALRNDRFEIDELHLMDPNRSRPIVSPETGDVFYALAGNDVIDRRLGALDLQSAQLMVPSRDVLHIRLHVIERTKYPWPLIGETPLMAALTDMELYWKIKNQQENFFNNQARPSAVLSTDLVLDKDQVAALRDRWNEQTKGLAAGGVPILTSGLKVQQWAVPGGARDLQVAELLRMTQDQIALVFRIPLAILGIERASAGSTEQLYSSWLASGLGFCLNHIEEAFGNLFELRGVPDEYLEFDTDALLRSAKKERMDMLARGVQGGIYSPNEARAREDLPEVEYGDEPRVQQQVVPLSAAGAIPAPAPGRAGGGGALVPSAPPAPPASPAAAQPLVQPTPKLLKPPMSKAQLEYLTKDLFKAADECDRMDAA
jgi:HK97 family phage portal protein